MIWSPVELGPPSYDHACILLTLALRSCLNAAATLASKLPYELRSTRYEGPIVACDVFEAETAPLSVILEGLLAVGDLLCPPNGLLPCDFAIVQCARLSVASPCRTQYVATPLDRCMPSYMKPSSQEASCLTLPLTSAGPCFTADVASSSSPSCPCCLMEVLVPLAVFLLGVALELPGALRLRGVFCDGEPSSSPLPLLWTQWTA